MADKKTPLYLRQQEIFPGLVSIVIPLIQLTAVVVVGLSDTFHIAGLLIFPDFLNVINLLTILATISAIGWFWYWRSNIHWLIDPEELSKRSFNDQQIRTEKMLRFSLWTGVFFFVLFIGTTVISFQGHWGVQATILGISQYLSYSLFLILSGLVIYVWIYEFILKKQAFQREDFTRNLLITLEEYAIIPPPKVKILKNESIRGFERSVTIEVDGKKNILRTSGDGLEIMEIQSGEEYEKTRGATVEELQAQINALLEQLSELQNPTPPTH